MITIEIPIEGQTIKVNVDDARQAVSFVRGLYLKKAGAFPFSPPEISLPRKNGHVKKITAEIFETLRDPGYNSSRDTGSSQAPKKKGGEL